MATFKSFVYTMEEIRDMWGEPAGKDLYFIASMTDYYYLETLTSTAVTHVYKDGIKLKVLGRNIRTFKPGVPFNIQVNVNYCDVLKLLCHVLSYKPITAFTSCVLVRKLTTAYISTYFLVLG